METLGPTFKDIGDSEGQNKVIMRIDSNTLGSPSSSLLHDFRGHPNGRALSRAIHFALRPLNRRCLAKLPDGPHGRFWQSEISHNLLFFCGSQYTPQLFGKERLLKKE